MVRTILAVTAIALGISVAAAQDPIAARKAAMKATGAQAAIGAKMMKGEEPFDLAKAKAIFARYEQTSNEVKSLFPDNAKSGGESTAAPKIWEDKAGFEARLAKFGADAKAASEKVTNLDTFKANFPEVMKNCGGCHEVYRIKKS